MEQYAGIDVSLDSASVCIVDVQGKILKEAKVVCEPEALIAWLAAHGTPVARIGLEAGPNAGSGSGVLPPRQACRRASRSMGSTCTTKARCGSGLSRAPMATTRSRCCAGSAPRLL